METCIPISNRWGPDKFPKETPLVFYKAGKPILPALEMLDGLKVVLQNMVIHIQRAFPNRILKFWRLQSPRHFHGGDWNQNGSCLFNKPLEESEVGDLPWLFLRKPTCETVFEAKSSLLEQPLSLRCYY